MIHDFLMNSWWQVGLILVAVVVAWKEIQDNKKLLTDHLDPKNPMPHPQCPVHSERFNEVLSSLASIEKRIEVLDRRFYEYTRGNGYKTGAIE